MRTKSASGVLASLSGSPYGTSTIRRLRHCRLTVSPASTDVALIILRAVDLVAALLDGLFAHPARSSDPNTPRELIVAYCAKVESAACLDEPLCSFHHSLFATDRPHSGDHPRHVR